MPMFRNWPLIRYTSKSHEKGVNGIGKTKFSFIVIGAIIKLKSRGGFFVINLLNYEGINDRIIHVCFIIVHWQSKTNCSSSISWVMKGCSNGFRSDNFNVFPTIFDRSPVILRNFL